MTLLNITHVTVHASLTHTDHHTSPASGCGGMLHTASSLMSGACCRGGRGLVVTRACARASLQLMQGEGKRGGEEHQTSHVTRHTPHVTRHTSHATRHTSHATRHTTCHSHRNTLRCRVEGLSVLHGVGCGVL